MNRCICWTAIKSNCRKTKLQLFLDYAKFVSSICEVVLYLNVCLFIFYQFISTIPDGFMTYYQKKQVSLLFSFLNFLICNFVFYLWLHISFSKTGVDQRVLTTECVVVSRASTWCQTLVMVQLKNKGTLCLMDSRSSWSTILL